MSETNEEVMEAMDTSHKESSSDSETAKSEIIDVGLGPASVKSASSISSTSVGDDKISIPEILEPIPEFDSSPSIERHEQEDEDSKPILPKTEKDHPVSKRPRLESRDRFPLVNINNSFFSTPQTLNIHKEYMKLFDFKKFRQARSLDLNSYDTIVSIAEVPLFLSRFLLEDLLDFVDFFNGTKTELFVKEQSMLNRTYSEFRKLKSMSQKFGTDIEELESQTLKETCVKARKLAFMRPNFGTGIQQLESQTINHLFKQIAYIEDHDEDFAIYEIIRKPAERNVREDPSNVSDSDTSCVIVSDSGSPENSKRSSRISTPIYRGVSYSAIGEMSLGDKISYLAFKKVDIIKSVFSCICSTRLVLDFCLEPDYRDNKTKEFEKGLKEYLSNIKGILERLTEIRNDCCMLLSRDITGSDVVNILVILTIKIYVGRAFTDLLKLLSETNAKLLKYKFF